MQFSIGYCKSCGCRINAPGPSYMHWWGVCPRCFGEIEWLDDRPPKKEKPPELPTGDALERLRCDSG